MNPKRTTAVITFLASLVCILPESEAQSESEVVPGNWNCAVEGMKDPVIFQLLEDDKAQMCFNADGERPKDWTRGKWIMDDLDFDDDDQPVVTIKVTWDTKNSQTEKKEMTVRLTILSEDKMEVRWESEPMRIWTRIKPEDEDDRGGQGK